MKPQEFHKKIDGGKIPPVVVLVGEDDYVRREIVDRLKAKVVGDSDPLSCLESWDGEEQTAADIADSANQMAFGGTKKLVVVNRAESLLGEEEILGAYFQNPCPSSVVVFCLDKLDMRRKLAKMIEELCAVVSLEDPYHDQRDGEIARLLGRYPELKFQPDALASLRDWVGEDLGALSKELEKISLALPGKARIETSDIEDLVFRQETQNVFDLAGAVAARDRKTALDLLIRLMRDGKSALEILGLLRSQGEKLYQAAELLKAGKPPQGICQTLRIPGFFCNDFLGKAKKLSAVPPARFFTLIYESDKAIKTSLWRENIAAELLVMKIC